MNDSLKNSIRAHLLCSSLHIDPHTVFTDTPSLAPTNSISHLLWGLICDTGKEVGPIVLNLPFCEPFWKLLLGIPLNLMDLQLLDPTEFRSLMTVLGMDIDGLIFDSFSWSFTHPAAPAGERESDSLIRRFSKELS